jgi:glycosyltransferase involved in cell wall biosynthesis
MAEIRRLIFDLTGSSVWPGPPTGIIKTERKLGMLAPQVTRLPVEYCVFDQKAMSFFFLNPKVLGALFAGALAIEYENPLSGTRSSFLRQPRKYLLSKIRSLEEVLGRALVPARQSKSGSSIPLREAVRSRAEFTNHDVVISCGPDWNGKDMAEIWRQKREIGFRYVSTCYDVIPWRHPHFWPEGFAERVVSHYGEMAWVADLVMCISRKTAEEYEELCLALDVPCPRLEVFRLGDTEADNVVAARLPSELEGSKFVLMVASIEPRKNHWLLYNVWEDLIRSNDIPTDVKLVFAGSSKWMTTDLLLQIKLNPILRDRIVILHRVPQPQLNRLYRECLFTVYPSFHEGWGLPVAESLRHGKVCISSSRGSLPEISPLAVLLDPFDTYSWRDAMRKHIVDTSLRAAAEARIRHEFVPTTWEQTAQSFFDPIVAL